jgi:membrane protein required for colicin V production
VPGVNWVDAAIVGVFVVSALLAFLRGFVREVLGIGAWIGAAAAAIWGGPLVLPKVHQWIADPNVAYAVAYAAVFLGALILLSVLAGMVGGLVRGSLLGGLDRTLGMVFGLARGAVLVAAAYIGLGLIAEPASWPQPVLHARSLPLAYAGATWLVGLLPSLYRPKLPPPPAQPETRAEDLLQPPAQGRAVAQP